MESIYQLTFQIIKHFKESLNFHLRWGENGKKTIKKNMPYTLQVNKKKKQTSDDKEEE